MSQTGNAVTAFLSASETTTSNAEAGDHNPSLEKAGDDQSHEGSSPEAHAIAAIAAARARFSGLISGFIGYRVPTYWQAYDRVSNLLRYNIFEQWPRVPHFVGIVPVGFGKSSTTCREIGKNLRQIEISRKDASVVYFVPRHDLAEELAAKFTSLTGIPAAIWRGIEAADPDAPGLAMCREPNLSQAARHAHVDLETVCRVCPSRDLCGYRRQVAKRSKVWFLPHQMLFVARPKTIAEPALVVIDEAFWQAGLSGFDSPNRLTTQSLGVIPATLEEGGREFVQESRAKLEMALTKIDADGRLLRHLLEDVGLDAEYAREAYRLEWAAKPEFKMKSYGSDLIAALEAHATLFDSRIPRLWKLIAAALAGSATYVTGVRLERQVRLRGGEGRADVLSLKWKGEVADSWLDRPTMILDATASTDLIKPYFPWATFPKVVEVEMPYQRVIQVIDRTFSKSMFFGSRKTSPQADTQENNIEKLRQLIELKAFEYRGKGGNGGDVLVVSQKAVEVVLRAGILPDRVALRHFNDIAGADIYKDVACVIIVGRTLPNVTDLEEMAEVLTGQPIARIGSNEWPKSDVEIRTKTGHSATSSAPYHPDLTTEAVRRGIAEANIVQAIGRGRGVNRCAADPVEVILLTDLPVPVAVAEIRPWEAMRPNSFQRAFILGNGIMPTSDSELARVYGPNGACVPPLWPSANAVKLDRRAHGNNGVKALLGSLIGLSPHYHVEYYLAGQVGRWSPALVRSTDPIVARQQLEAVVGPVAKFRML